MPQCLLVDSQIRRHGNLEIEFGFSNSVLLAAEIANYCRRTKYQELLDHCESTIYIPLCTCSGGKLLPAGKFKRAEENYRELLDRLLVERA